MPLKGQKMTQKQKGKISVSRKGYPAWNKGKRMSEETKLKISSSKAGQDPWNKDRAWSSKVKKKISKTKLIPETKFKRLYGNLELKFRGNFNEIDNWLVEQFPNITTIDCVHRKETLPTHVRHCINHAEHPHQYSRDELAEATRILSKVKLLEG